jgi:hypothetical protein
MGIGASSEFLIYPDEGGFRDAVEYLRALVLLEAVEALYVGAILEGVPDEIVRTVVEGSYF